MGWIVACPSLQDSWESGSRKVARKPRWSWRETRKWSLLALFSIHLIIPAYRLLVSLWLVSFDSLRQSLSSACAKSNKRCKHVKVFLYRIFWHSDTWDSISGSWRTEEYRLSPSLFPTFFTARSLFWLVYTDLEPGIGYVTWIIGSLSSNVFERHTTTEGKGVFFSFNMPRRCQICIAKCLYTCIDDLPKYMFNSAAQKWKTSASGWRLLLQNITA